MYYNKIEGLIPLMLHMGINDCNNKQKCVYSTGILAKLKKRQQKTGTVLWLRFD